MKRTEKRIPLEKIKLSRYQVRTSFNDDYINFIIKEIKEYPKITLDQLSEKLNMKFDISSGTLSQYKDLIGLSFSIRETGQISPAAVQQTDDNYELIAGERRYQAHRILSAETIDAFVYDDINDYSAHIMAGVENIQRDQLHSIEYENLIYNLFEAGKKIGQTTTHAQLAQKIGLSQQRISKILEAREYRQKSSLGTSIATEILIQTSSLADRYRKPLLKRVQADEITATDIESYVKAIEKTSGIIKYELVKMGSKITPKMAFEINKFPTEALKEKTLKSIIQQTDKNLIVQPEMIIQLRKTPNVELKEIINTYSRTEDSDIADKIITEISRSTDLEVRRKTAEILLNTQKFDESINILNICETLPEISIEVIQNEIMKASEERLDELTLAEINTLPEEQQKEIQARIKKEKFTQEKASAFVQAIKKQPESVREILLNSPQRIQFLEEEGREIEVSIQLDEEEQKKMSLAIETVAIEMQKIQQSPEFQDMRQLLYNQQAHMTLRSILGKLRCPHCEKIAIDHLRWTCHDNTTITKAIALAIKSYNKAQKGKKKRKKK